MSPDYHIHSTNLDALFFCADFLNSENWRYCSHFLSGPCAAVTAGSAGSPTISLCKTLGLLEWDCLQFGCPSWHSTLPYLHLATSEIWCWSGGRGILRKKLSLCYSIMYYYNGAQRYEQFLQVGRLYRALILLGLALYHPSAYVSSIFMMLCT